MTPISRPVRDVAGACLLVVLAGASPARAWGHPTPAAAPPGSAPAAAPEGAPAAPPTDSAPPAPDAAAPPPSLSDTPAPPTKPPAAWPVPPVPPALQGVGAPEDAAVLEGPPQPPVPRPRLSTAVGMGGSFDAVGFRDGDARAIPAFFAILGIGDGRLGTELSMFASQAAGRHGTENPIERLSVDLYGVVRPGAWIRPDDGKYQMRLLRGLGAELGLGLERDGRSAVSGLRFLIHTGLRVDFPLTPAREATEVRLRLAVRRGFGLYTPRLYYGNTADDVIHVRDSMAELYAALVVVF